MGSLAITKVLVTGLCLGLFFQSPAYGYLDPGAGSLILQTLVGGIAVIGSFLAINWARIKTFFTSFKKKSSES